MSNIFYNLNLDYEDRIQLMRQAYAIKKDWWFDKLDCGKSFHRQRVEVNFEEALTHLKPNSLCSLIYRNNEWENFYEVGFRSMEDLVDYFLWIVVDPIEVHKLFERFPDIQPIN